MKRLLKVGVWLVLLLAIALGVVACTSKEEQAGNTVVKPTWTATVAVATWTPTGVAPTPTAASVPTATGAPSPVAVGTGAGTSAGVPAGAETAQLVDVVDGDTIKVLVNGREESVRYVGIDTPERGQPGYRAATEANRALLGSGALFLVRDRTDRDRYDRLLRNVYTADGVFVDGEMVRQGWAQPVEYAPDTRHAAEFRQYALEAAQAGVGFWSGSSAHDGAMAYGLTTGPVNVLKGPGTTYEVSGSAAAGTPVTIFGRNQAGDWVQVRMPDRSGGWMYVPLLAVAVPVTGIGVTSEGVAASPAATATSGPAGVPPAAAAPVVAAPVQSGSGGLRLGVLNYDGAVPSVESDEYMEIVNGGGPINLQGWRLMDDDGNVFAFPAFEMAAGQACRVYTNESHPEWCGFSFGSGQAVWGNSGDVVILTDPSGAVVDQKCWKSGC